MSSTGTKIVAAVLVIVLAVVVLYSALTFPRAEVNLQVSFTVGVDREAKEFDVPFLQDKALVEVGVTTGTALWRASITDANGSEVWSYSKAQGDQLPTRADGLRFQADTTTSPSEQLESAIWTPM